MVVLFMNRGTATGQDVNEKIASLSIVKIVKSAVQFRDYSGKMMIWTKDAPGEKKKIN